eukprot:scaffold1869_cov122-Cylindrotheca_fusiformis.AAC.40
MEIAESKSRKWGSVVLLVIFYIFQHPSLALLPRLGCHESSHGMFKRRNVDKILFLTASQYESNGNRSMDEITSELEKTMQIVNEQQNMVEEQQNKINMLLEALNEKDSGKNVMASNSSEMGAEITAFNPPQKDVQLTSTPLKVMLFIDGTWLYYSLHERDDVIDPIVQRYGKGWQYKYNVDWGALPRVICKALQEQDRSQGWSTVLQDAEKSGRPIEVVRVLVYTSYKANTPKHSFRYQMFQEMLNAKYDVHMMETVGPGEKCIDIQLAVDVLHYATMPHAYDIAVLLTGDKDYMPAMVRTRQKGRRVGLVSMRSGCNKALRESANIKDYDVIFLEDHLNEILRLKTETGIHKRTPNVSQFTLMKVIFDFIKMSGMQRVNSRDIGKYMKPMLVGNRRLLDEMKQTYGGLYQLLTVSDIFVVDRGTNDKEFWVAVKENAGFVLKEELKKTQFTRSEKKFFEMYTLDAIERDRQKYYRHSSDEQTSSAGSLIRELKTVSFSEALPKETESQDLRTLTVAKLKEICRERSLPVSGKKDELIRRIRDDIEAKREQQQPTAIEEMEPKEYLLSLILEYLQVKGGQASSRDIGRYLAANKASPKRSLQENGRVAALTELKELSGSLNKFILQTDSFEVKDTEDGDVFEFLICLK